MNDLVLDIQDIKVKQGSIQFSKYESILNQAENLAKHIKEVKVNAENIKHSKKLLASVNSEVKKLESERISIKNKMLEPYMQFEAKVKEITHIVKEADAVVRNQVRELEEQEREEKKKNIEELFNKRIKHYDFSEYFLFDDFLKNEYLNKSYTMMKVEKEIVSWLTKTENDTSIISKLPNAIEVLAEYKDTKDLAVAMKIVNEREIYYKELNEKKASVISQYHIVISNDKDWKLLEMFMNQNNIKYKLK